MLAGAVQHEALVLRLGHAAQLGRNQAARRRRVAERPQRGQEGGHEHQQPGGDQRLRALGHGAPVAVREVRDQRSAPRRGAVDERPRAHDQGLEPARDRVVAEAPPGVRQVRGRLPVARAEAQDISRRQPPRAAPGRGREAGELLPGRPARSRERVRVHARRCSSSRGRPALARTS